jgi:hypothetical protein
MKMGIGLPNTMAFETDRRLMLEWARRADEAGFDVLGTIDEPNFDSWDPLVTLAGAAGVTERARLATTILQLPPRNEVLVAKQAAVVDQLSGGRLVLGLAQGGREDDFEVFGAEFEGRGSSGRSHESERSGRPRANRTAITASSGLRPYRNPGLRSGRARCSPWPSNGRRPSLDQVDLLAEHVLPNYAG